MILYQYKCPKCDKLFEEVRPIEKRHYAPCPTCGVLSMKELSAASADVNFRPRWFHNIAPVPVYIKSREEFTKVANMLGNVSNRPFTKRESMKVVNPRKREKARIINKLKRGIYE